mmetsp:Transcript_50616/g.161995  ORF Transcript_50616/g.161995 Transcript_50616/m.161995 type:complete len:193 (-) Transcript_50616:179-757(-)
MGAADKVKAKVPKEDAKALANDVANFASSIGLASSHDGFDDRDFRGPAAKMDGPRKSPATSGKADKDVSAGAARAGRQDKGERPAKDEPRKKKGKESGVEPAGVRSRSWNLGAGPRPDATADGAAGTMRPRSILGKDEPARWHEALDQLPPIPGRKGPCRDDEVISSKRAQAEAAVEAEVKAFQHNLSKSSG